MCVIEWKDIKWIILQISVRVDERKKGNLRSDWKRKFGLILVFDHDDEEKSIFICVWGNEIWSNFHQSSMKEIFFSFLQISQSHFQNQFEKRRLKQPKFAKCQQPMEMRWKRHTFGNRYQTPVRHSVCTFQTFPFIVCFLVSPHIRTCYVHIQYTELQHMEMFHVWVGQKIR